MRVRFDFDTTTRSAGRTMAARRTLGTKIRSPAVSSLAPEFNSASSFGELWNLSPSSLPAFEAQPLQLRLFLDIGRRRLERAFLVRSGNRVDGE